MYNDAAKRRAEGVESHVIQSKFAERRACAWAGGSLLIALVGRGNARGQRAFGLGEIAAHQPSTIEWAPKRVGHVTFDFGHGQPPAQLSL